MWPDLAAACVSLARDGWHQHGGPLMWTKVLHGRPVHVELVERGDLVHAVVWDPQCPAFTRPVTPPIADPVTASSEYDWAALCSDLDENEVVDLAALAGAME